MQWLQEFIRNVMKVMPFLERWVSLQEKKIPMKVVEHDEQAEIRKIKNEIKVHKKSNKLNKKIKKSETKNETQKGRRKKEKKEK